MAEYSALFIFASFSLMHLNERFTRNEEATRAKSTKAFHTFFGDVLMISFQQPNPLRTEKFVVFRPNKK